MISKPSGEIKLAEPIDYEKMVDMFSRALIHTLRKHSVADSFLDFWVPDADPVLGISGMVDSARISGLPEIEIRFNRSTLPLERHAELQHALGKVCTLFLQPEGDRVLLRATNMKENAQSEAARAVRQSKQAYRQAINTSQTSVDQSDIASRWKSDELPEFADVHPHFRAALQSALGKLAYERDPPSSNDGLVPVSGSEGSIKLSLAIDPKSHLVRTAYHNGAQKPSERAILDLFCKEARGLPIQEVADHTALKVLDLLIDDDKPPPVGGVLLPFNAGAPFKIPARLARKAYDEYRAKTGVAQETNFYYALPKPGWQGLNAEERAEKVDYVLRAFLQSEGLYPDDMKILQIAKNKYGYHVRIIVGFSDRVPVAVKPKLMRALELRLRRDLEPEIDLIADRARDTSPLRRLSEPKT